MGDKIAAIMGFAICGLVFVIISIPLILEKIPPNRWYGFRTEKTLSNSEIWYRINKYTGKDLFIVGILLLLIAPVLFVSKDRLPETVINLLGLLIVVLLVAIVVRGLLYLRKM